MNDAEEVFARSRGEIGLEPEHVSILDRIEPCMSTLENFAIADLEQHREQIIDALFCVFPEPAAKREEVDFPSKCSLDVPAKVHALTEQTFELKGIAPSLVPGLLFQWTLTQGGRAANQSEVILGGPRLSWVFQKAEGDVRVEVKVTCASPGGVLVQRSVPDGRAEAAGFSDFRWFSYPVHVDPPTPPYPTFTVHPESSLLVRLRLTAWIVQQGVFLGGIALVAAVAAFYWMDKPFGNSTDYLNLLLAGAGVDAGTSSAGIRGLLTKLVTRSEPKAQEGKA